jgi:coniferyl-aldehyde dehydrogenase
VADFTVNGDDMGASEQALTADQVQAQLRDWLAQQRRAFEAHRFPSVQERRAHLGALEQMLHANVDRLADAVDADFGGRSKHETFMIDWLPSIDGVHHARRHVGRWAKPRRAGVALSFMPASARVMPQPLGVIGIVVPWNYPLLLALGPLTAALAAGNRAMIKMSEFTPRTGELLASLLREHFSEDHVRVVNGDADVARAFSALPFDHLLFTGSTSVGRHVMRAAAEHLTPVTLELGGKSPVIVAPDFSMDLAAERVIFGKCLNAGQSCTAPDYVLVPASHEAAFVQALQKQVARLYPTIARNPDYTAVVNARQHQRLQGYLADAVAKGGRVVPLNASGEDLSGSLKIAPTVVQQCTDDMLVMQDEIFGPLLPIVSYRTLDEALAFVNARPRPLALYYFSNDRASVDRVTRETIAGGVTINDTMYQVAQHNLPFGGVGPSGMGHYHGQYGFDTFSKQKGVLYQARFSGTRLMQPPYGKLFETMRTMLSKVLLKL